MTEVRTTQCVPIFLGSTFVDLETHRAAARDALHRLEAIVRCMEYFGSKPGKPIEECLNSVRSCKVYIGIFGMRYGSIPDGYDRSMTHLEYDEAQRLKLPSLIYLIDEKSQPILPIHVDTDLGAEKLRLLKQELRKTHLISLFTTEADLAAKILHDLPPVLERLGATINGSLQVADLASSARVEQLCVERESMGTHQDVEQTPSSNLKGRFGHPPEPQPHRAWSRPLAWLGLILATCVAVVLGGAKLLPTSNGFSMTVFVHGPNGLHEIPVRNSGHVILDLEGDRRKQGIGEKGEAHFSGISTHYKNREVPLFVEADGFESVGAAQVYPLKAGALYLAIRRKPERVTGRVQNEAGDAISGATVAALSSSTTSDELGRFVLEILPGEIMAREFEIDVAAAGYRSGHYKGVLNSSPLFVRLIKAP